MDYKELVEALKEILPEKIPYGELVGAPWPYSEQGEMVYEEPECYTIEQAATAITELLARAEAAEAREKNLIEAVQKEKQEAKRWCAACAEQYKLIEKLEEERDAAIMDCSGYCSTCAFESDCAKHDMNDAAPVRWYYGDCEDWEWRGKKEE